MNIHVGGEDGACIQEYASLLSAPFGWFRGVFTLPFLFRFKHIRLSSSSSSVFVP